MVNCCETRAAAGRPEVGAWLRRALLPRHVPNR